jgi:hypothetical protein
MRSFTWPGSDLASEKVAALLPGAGYTAHGPLLHGCAELLVERGWRVEAIEWTITDDDRSRGRAVAEEGLELAFSEATGTAQRLIVAKSFGTYALPSAVSADIPGVWLTPVLTDPDIRDALERAPSSHLAIGGSADSLWGPATELATAASLVTIPDADHGLEVSRDGRRSVEVHSTVFDRVHEWVAALT